MNLPTTINNPVPTAQPDRANVIAACLTVLVNEVSLAGIETQDAFDLLRDAPDKIRMALARGQGALVVYRLDKTGARGMVSDSDSRLKRFTALAEKEGAPLFGFCPATIAKVATYISAGAGSLKKDA